MVESLSLDPIIAAQLCNACDEWLNELRRLSLPAQRLGTLDGFGTLGSAMALKRKFEQKAVGGPDALVDVLASHIAVVDEMRAQFQACIDNAVNQESANAAALRTIDLPN